MRGNSKRKWYFAFFLIVLICAIFAWSAAAKLIQDDSIAEKVATSTVSNFRQPQVTTQPTQTEVPKNQSDQTNEFNLFAQQIRNLTENKDLDGLVGLENNVNASFAEKDLGLYTDLMVSLCGAMTSHNFNNDEQYLLARQCTKKALARLDKMPIGRALELVTLLGGDNEYILGLVPQTNWPADRTERMQLWCRAWQRLEAEIDENFDFNANHPIYHQRMTSEDQQKAEKYNQQRFLQRDKKNYTLDFERFLVDAYSKPPYNTPELEKFLRECTKDKALRDRVTTRIRQKVAAIGDDN